MSTIILVEYRLDFWINLVYLTLLTSMLDQTCMVDIFLSNLLNYNYSYNLQLQSSCHNTYIIQVACWHIFIACRSTYIKHRENAIIIMLFLSSCSVHGNFTCNSSYKKASPMHPTLIHRKSYITCTILPWMWVSWSSNTYWGRASPRSWYGSSPPQNLYITERVDILDQ